MPPVFQAPPAASAGPCNLSPAESSSPPPTRPNPNVGALLELREKMGCQGMKDRFTGRVGFESLLRHVGFVVAAVDQNAIPGFVLGRTRARDVLVPFLRSEEDRAGIIDDASIVKQAMVNGLPSRKFGLGVHVPAPPIEAAQMSGLAPWSEANSLDTVKNAWRLSPLEQAEPRRDRRCGEATAPSQTSNQGPD